MKNLSKREKTLLIIFVSLFIFYPGTLIYESMRARLNNETTEVEKEDESTPSADAELQWYEIEATKTVTRYINRDKSIEPITFDFPIASKTLTLEKQVTIDEYDILIRCSLLTANPTHLEATSGNCFVFVNDILLSKSIPVREVGNRYVPSFYIFNDSTLQNPIIIVGEFIGGYRDFESIYSVKNGKADKMNIEVERFSEENEIGSLWDEVEMNLDQNNKPYLHTVWTDPSFSGKLHTELYVDGNSLVLKDTIYEKGEQQIKPL